MCFHNLLRWMDESSPSYYLLDKMVLVWCGPFQIYHCSHFMSWLKSFFYFFLCFDIFATLDFSQKIRKGFFSCLSKFSSIRNINSSRLKVKTNELVSIKQLVFILSNKNALSKTLMSIIDEKWYPLLDCKKLILLHRFSIFFGEKYSIGLYFFIGKRSLTNSL